MPLSKYPELKGALFPSLDAMQLAEKKVDAQRAEQARIEAEAQAERDREEAERQAKVARIEAKRQAAELRLQDMTARHAIELEQEADRLAEELRRKDAEKKQQEEEQANRLAREADLEKQRLLADAQREAQLRAAQMEEIERQKQARRDEMERRQRRAEILAETTWLQGRVREGKLRVQRVDGEFIVLDASTGTPMPDQAQFNWLYHAESLAGLNVEVKDTPAPAPADKKKMSLTAGKVRLPSVSEEGSPSNKGPDLDKIVRRYKVKETLEDYLITLPTALDRLRSPGGVHEALLELYHFSVLCLSKGGAVLFQDMCDNPKAVQALTDSPEVLAAIIKHSPGNMHAIAILGVQQFAGDEVLSSRIGDLEAIPVSFDEWMGWLAACNVFFQYLLWEEDGGADTQEPFESGVLKETEGNVQAATAGRRKLDQLIDAYNLPNVGMRHIDAMMSRFPEALDELSSLRNNISNAKASATLAVERKLAKMAEEAGATQIQEDKERAQQLANQADAQLEAARLKLSNCNAKITNATDASEKARERFDAIKAELAEIADQEQVLHAREEFLSS